MEKGKAVIYVRVSTEEQAKQPQEAQCRDYCRRHEITVAGDSSDGNETSPSTDRPIDRPAN
jgi:DNA invertase Pin-like site-specific DNA recombinase